MANTYTTKTVTWGNGRNDIWAGTPVDTNGKVANDATAIGVAAEDLHMPDRSLSVLTAGEWDETAPENQKSGIILSNAAKKAMSDIEFTVPPVTLIDAEALSDTLEDYVKNTDLPGAATTASAGIVKQAEAVSDAEDAPTMAEFNGLLASLRTAGVLETEEVSGSDQEET